MTSPRPRPEDAWPATRVSVVVTTTGRPELGAVLSAARAQTLVPSEIIVVDDRPGDIGEPLAMGESGTSPLRLLRSHGRGANTARNMGINHATGEVIALLDDDDFWAPEKLEAQVRALLRTAGSLDGCHLVFCQYTDEGRGGTRRPPEAPPTDRSLEEWLFCPRWPMREVTSAVQTSGLLFPVGLRDLLQFDESLRTHQDWDWVIRFGRLPGSELHFVPRPLYILTSHAANKTSASRNLQGERSWAIATMADSAPRALFGYLMCFALPRSILAGDPLAATRCVLAALTRGKFHFPSLMRGVHAGAGALILRLRRGSKEHSR